MRTEGNRGERLWVGVNEWRAVATLYEKTSAASFTGVLCLTAAFDRLKR